MLKSVATRPVVTIPARATVSVAARTMREHDVGALVVVNSGRPLGMLTDRDIALEVVALGGNPDVVRVRDIMHEKPTTIALDAGVLDAAKLFARTGFRRLPVVSRSGQLVGILAVDDLIVLLGTELGHLAGGLTAGLRRTRPRRRGAA
jgi:CBS domain-containing protein